MEKALWFNTIVAIWIGIALLLFPVLLRVTAPYGRHTRRGWGPLISNRTGWIIMELPALLVFWAFAFSGAEKQAPFDYLFIALWSAHYLNRSIVYPFRIRTHGKKMPLSIAGMAIFFNTINGFLNGFYFGHLPHAYPDTWLTYGRFLAGLALFTAGMAINLHADQRLISLRNNHTGVYSIPRGGLFGFVSCPNFLGELIEWLGFALMVWSMPAFSFFIWTAVNLVPRALDHHRWYRWHFSDYPANRKAIIPWLL
jgi:3-oxo-5-alpha-steroid 4-dehydrogenase 1